MARAPRWRSSTLPGAHFHRRMMRLVVTAFAFAFALAGCAEQSASPPSPTPSPSPTPDQSLGNECHSPQGGYPVSYPDDWHVNDPEGGNACSWFHPESFELPVATEPTELAIHIDVESSSFERLAEGVTTGPHVKEVLSREEMRLAEQEALRIEILNSGEGLYPEDTRQTTYLVSWDGQTLVATTTSAAEGNYEQHVDVLDRMMQSLERRQSDATCSAAALNAELTEQEGLPEPVAAMRQDIVNAAVECDFERLSELAERGEGTFNYSFGDTGNPAEFWRRLEEEEPGEAPMRYLVGVLKRPFATQTVEGRTQYVWPAAFSYHSWEAVPEDQKEALKPLYDDLDFRNFSQFGGYAGYRVGIDQSGNWLFFVAGD